MIFTTQSGQSVGPIGQGTWYLGEDPSLFPEEYKALRTGVEAGMNLIDTAEMYGDGAAEELVGFSIQGMDRSKLFLVSKVYPFNAGQRHIFTSCEDSLRRMKTDYLDLYLLHWRGSIPPAGDRRMHGRAESERPHPGMGRFQSGHGRYAGAVR